LIKKIGSGVSGDVWLGTWDGKEVAVKKYIGLEEVTIFEFSREIEIISKFQHPNIVKYYGASFIYGDYFIVFEYVKLGNLSEVIHSDNKNIDWPLILRINLDISCGMQFLHDNNIIHRDLKPDNILVESITFGDPVLCKVSDFGHSREKSIDMTPAIGTRAYSAPEILIPNKKYNEKIDVYSFGIIMWQVYTREKPYMDEKDIFSIEAKVLSGLRPLIPTQIPNNHTEYFQLLTECWQDSHGNRPSFSVIIERFRNILDEYIQNEILKKSETES